MATRGRSARNKGLSFERYIAGLIRPYFPAIRRQLEFQIEDALGTDLQGCEPFKIQCKKRKAYVSINTINEIKCDRELGDVPVLVTAGDGLPTMAVLHFDDLLRLIKSSTYTENKP